jgi:type III secretion protein J
MRTPMALLGLALVCSGCAVPVAASLDDPEANRIVVALDRAGIDSAKEIDPTGEGKWRVSVSRDEVAPALLVLRDEELPRTSPQGVLDAVGKGSLVPSEAAEHAQLVRGMGGDLERSLEGIEGVLSAHVHLNLPSPGPLRDTPVAHASASVLLEYRGATPPIAADNVQRLVAGGCGGLLPPDVAVIMVSRPSPVHPSGSELTHVGPVAVAHASARLLQVVLVCFVLVVAALALALLILMRRLSQARQELAVQQIPTVKRP